MFVSIYLKSTNILYSDILQKPFIVISACRTYCTIPVSTAIFLKMNEDTFTLTITFCCGCVCGA